LRDFKKLLHTGYNSRFYTQHNWNKALESGEEILAVNTILKLNSFFKSNTFKNPDKKAIKRENMPKENLKLMMLYTQIKLAKFSIIELIYY
jgi:hypothetical protein